MLSEKIVQLTDTGSYSTNLIHRICYSLFIFILIMCLMSMNKMSIWTNFCVIVLDHFPVNMNVVHPAQEQTTCYEKYAQTTHYAKRYKSNGMIQIQRYILFLTRFFIGWDILLTIHHTVELDNAIGHCIRDTLPICLSGTFCVTIARQFNKRLI